MQIKNISQIPKRYYGRHFAPGVVNYPENKKMLYVSPEIAKQMDETFQGRPLFVEHIEGEVDLETVNQEADGWVIRSFYEPLDGSHWTEFLVISDDAHKKIEDGWTLSNSYIIEEEGDGGTWHNVVYDACVEKAYYDHLSLVDNPRYEESIILTPEEFKTYQEELKGKIESIKNSKGVTKMAKFELFKKKVEKVDNQKDIENMSVKLPKSGVEKTITQLINEADEAEVKKDEKKYANEADVIKIGEDEITVAELVAKVTLLLEEGAEEVTEEVEEDIIDEDVIDNEVDDEDEIPAKPKAKKDNSKSALSLLGTAKKPLQTKNEKPARISHKASLELGKKLY